MVSCAPSRGGLQQTHGRVAKWTLAKIKKEGIKIPSSLSVVILEWEVGVTLGRW